MFQFDPDKKAINLRKHNLTLDAAPLLFEGSYVEEVDGHLDYRETRFIASGPLTRSHSDPTPLAK